MSDYEKNRIKEIYEEMLTLHAELDQILQRTLMPKDYEHIKLYGLSAIESGLTRDGSSCSSTYTVQDIVEELHGSSFDEDYSGE